MLESLRAKTFFPCTPMNHDDTCQKRRLILQSNWKNIYTYVNIVRPKKSIFLLEFLWPGLSLCLSVGWLISRSVWSVCHNFLQELHFHAPIRELVNITANRKIKKNEDGLTNAQTYVSWTKRSCERPTTEWCKRLLIEMLVRPKTK